MTDQIQDQDVELDDEEIEEAHDPKNAEAQSFAANDKAEAAVKGKAKARKGDKSNSDPMQKMSAAMKAESIEINGDFSDDLDALVESEATLSEEFKAKTAIIFEAAVKSKIVEEIDRLEEAYATELHEEIAITKADLVEKIDSYLNYVVEQWMEENKLAIQNGLRAEIAEGFMSKLKDLFTESYIEVPEAKVDLVDELATANEELEEQANRATAKAIKLSEELVTYKRQAIIREATRDLAETQVEKLTQLAQSVEFVTEEEFASKVKTLKESYFSAKTAKSVIADHSDEDTDTDAVSHTSAVMEQYVQALRKTTNKQ